MVIMIINFFVSILDALFSTLPRITFFDGIAQGLNAIFDFFYQLSPLIPFSTLFICLNVISIFYVSLFVMNTVKFVIHRIPFLN